MRQERPYLADLYPVGRFVCQVCGEKNLAGESFKRDDNTFTTGYHCPDCHKAIEDREKQKQANLYASGEEEPYNTDEITCPWCGHEQGDSWEAADSDDKCECGECGKIYSYERNYEVTYSSSRVEEKD